MASLPSTNDSSHLAAFFYGPTLVGHQLNATQTILYARQNVALGKGHLGQVYMETAQNQCEGFPLIRAVREINKAQCSDLGVDWQAHIRNLVTLSSCDKHDLFQSFYGWYENPKTMFLAAEYFPLGDLTKYIKSISEDNEVKTVVRQLVSALGVSHKHNIVHGNLNPGNIFVATSAPTWQIKIGDFGSSNRVHEKTGTTSYTAPECYNFAGDGSDHHDTTAASDMWSIGCIVYELFAKERLFHEDGKVLEQYCAHPSLLEILTKNLAGLDTQKAIQRFLEPRAEDRITALEALSSTWLDSKQNSATSQLALDEDLEKLTVNQPVAKQSTPATPPIIALHSAAAETGPPISSITPANNTQEAMAPLAKIPSPSQNFNSNPPPPPRRLPSMGAESTKPLNPGATTSPKSLFTSPTASLNATYSRLSSSAMPTFSSLRRKLSSQTTPASDVNTSSSTKPAVSPGASSMTNIAPATPPTRDIDSQLFPQQPALPPRLPVRGSTAETSQQSVMQGPNSRDDVLDSAQLVPVNSIERKSYDPMEKWFMVGFGHEQWYMSFGPLTGQEDEALNCDLCEHTVRLTGNKRVVGENFLHLCKSCGKGRVLCELCARDAIHVKDDHHQADHTLRRVGPSFSFSFPDLLSSSGFPTQPTISGAGSAEFGNKWLASDHGFRAPDTPPSDHFQARFVLDVPAGSHEIAVNLRIAFDRVKIGTGVIGAARIKWMTTTKEPFGHIDVGVQLLQTNVNPSDLPPEQYMPDNHVETGIMYDTTRNEYKLTTELENPVQAKAGDRLALVIRSTYDSSTFKQGCPFTWYLDTIGLSQFGKEIQLATRGELTHREGVIAEEAKQEEKEKREKSAEKHKKFDANMSAFSKMLANIN